MACDVEPFLPIEARHHRYQRYIIALGQASSCLQGPFVANPIFEPRGVEVTGQVLVGSRIPNVIVEAIEDAMQVEMAMLQKTAQTRAVSLIYYLPRICRADGVDKSRMIDPASHKIDLIITLFSKLVCLQSEKIEDPPARAP